MEEEKIRTKTDSTFKIYRTNVTIARTMMTTLIRSITLIGKITLIAGTTLIQKKMTKNDILLF
jgi:hypothetical protein